MQNKIRLLSTRLLDENTTAKTADANIYIHSVSFIQTQSIFSDELTNHLQQLATEPLCVVFTSANAVSAVAELIQQPNWKIFCVSGKTKEHVIAAFGEDAILASAKNAHLLAERIIALNSVKKVVFFCGDQHLNILSQKLLEHNIVTDEIIVYTTLPTPQFIEENYDGILFFSPSAVHSFFSMNTVPIDTVFFSIGDTTTAAIQSYCTNKIITSDWPGVESLLEQVTHFYYEASHQVE
ncbi:MAG: uroporphyrinogen-III synthase [Bacteroidota bacterium]|nr:uroporphyrinogen-III synthase [Bacteroidota bacterium]